MIHRISCIRLDEQTQQVQDQQHEQEETKQPHQTTSPFDKDLTKAIEATRVEEKFRFVIGA
jgi:hypothetical protein